MTCVVGVPRPRRPVRTAPPLALRRSRRSLGLRLTVSKTSQGRGLLAKGPLDPDALATLEEQQRFLQGSLRDLEREHDAGDLDDVDYATLKHDYEERLGRGHARGRRGAGGVRGGRDARRAQARTAAIVAGVIVFALLCGFFVARNAGRRDPGNTITGDITQTAREQNTQCLTEARDDPSKAISCYTSVLADGAAERRGADVPRLGPLRQR